MTTAYMVFNVIGGLALAGVLLFVVLAATSNIKDLIKKEK